MKKFQLGFISVSDFYAFLFIVVFIGFAIGAFVFLAIPEILHFLKPWLNSVTK